MDEVDKIIIHSLRDVGCNISDETESLETFTTELIIEAAAKCLEIISPESNIPKTLPINMAARFQVGATIAETCKELGYSGDVGYQTFLYSNVDDLRRVFIFLIEKLPRESERTAEPEQEDSAARLRADIRWAIRSSLNTRLTLEEITTTPFISVPLETGIVVPNDKLNMSPKEWSNYCTDTLKFLPEQCPPQFLFASLIALNEKSCLPKTVSKRTNATTISENQQLQIGQFKVPVPTPRGIKRPMTWLSQQENILFDRASIVSQNVAISDQLVDEGKKSVDQKQDGVESKTELEIDSLKCCIEALQLSVRKDASDLVNVMKDCEAVEEELKGRTKEYETLCKALELLPNYEENISKIEGMISISNKRFESLKAQWDAFKKPVMTKHEELKKKTSNVPNGFAPHENPEASIQSKLDIVANQIVRKEKALNELQKDLDQLPKNIVRSSYTCRILEIIGNIKKQKDEIDKILVDTRDLQRRTNGLYGTLERLFTVVDETIFRNAKKDEHSKKSYKHLATIHTDCSDIVRMVVETGSIQREIRDLQEQVELEASKKVSDNLERISADMRLLKEENVALTKQLNL